MEQSFVLTDLRTSAVRQVVAGDRKMPGWTNGITGWSIGGPGSGADIVLDLPLEGISLGIFPAGNHTILWGRSAPGAHVPEISIEGGRGWPTAERGADIYLRFDGAPLRIGPYLVTMTGGVEADDREERSSSGEIEKIQANARLALETLAPISGIETFGFNRESVVWVEQFIEQQRSRPEVTLEERRRLASVLGCFLGACILRTYGGTWRKTEDGWGICFDGQNAAFPLTKVEKQFEHGVARGDSILGFFDGIGPLFGRGFDMTATPAVPSQGDDRPRRFGRLPVILIALLVLGVLAAIVIPSLSQRRRIPPENPAIAGLRQIAAAQSEFQERRRRVAGKGEYWKSDVAGLYAQKGEDGVPIGLLHPSLAAADDRPATEISAGHRGPKAGYWYRALRFEDEKSPDPARFAVLAHPEAAGGGQSLFLVTGEGRLYRKALSSAGTLPDVCPTNPALAGWTTVD